MNPAVERSTDPTARHTSSRHCPGCGGESLRDLGRIPTCREFAGVPLERPAAGDRLLRCRGCALVFRSPVPSAEALNELYRRGANHTWTPGEGDERLDWAGAQRRLAAADVRSVLDVGTFDGGFLAGLGEGVTTFGVEPHREAREHAARTYGTTILGDDIGALPADLRLDAITAFDVIEHVHDPAAFLGRLRSHLAPGGRIILSTGDADVWSWRLAGARYWYCHYPEHIAFIGRRWLEANLPALGLRIEHEENFARGGGSPVADLAKNAAYRLAPRALERMRRQRFARRGIHVDGPLGPPPWFSSRDHLLLTLTAID